MLAKGMKSEDIKALLDAEEPDEKGRKEVREIDQESLLNIINVFSKYVFILPMRDKKCEAIAQILDLLFLGKVLLEFCNQIMAANSLTSTLPKFYKSIVYSSCSICHMSIWVLLSASIKQSRNFLGM